MRVLRSIDFNYTAPQFPPHPAVSYPMIMFLAQLIAFSTLTEALQFDVKKSVVEEIRTGRSCWEVSRMDRRP